MKKSIIIKHDSLYQSIHMLTGFVQTEINALNETEELNTTEILNQMSGKTNLKFKENVSLQSSKINSITENLLLILNFMKSSAEVMEDLDISMSKKIRTGRRK